MHIDFGSARAAKMRRTLKGKALAFLGMAGALAGSPVWAQTPAPPSAAARLAIAPEQLAEAHRVVDLAFPPAERERMFLAAQTSLAAQMRTVLLAQIGNDPGALAIINRHIDAGMDRIKELTVAHIPVIMEAIAHAYAREFTAAELQAIGTFAATPAGHRYITRSTALLADADVAEANKQLMREVQPITQQTRTDLIAELTAYFVDHPPKPSSGS